ILQNSYPHCRFGRLTFDLPMKTKKYQTKRGSHMSVATAENRIDLPRAAKVNKKIIIDRRKPATKKTAWAGRIISAVPVLFLVFDGAMKLMNAAPVVEAQNQLGIPQSLTLSIGILELACVLVYAIPGSSILGAILLTGYLGGATAHPAAR